LCYSSNDKKKYKYPDEKKDKNVNRFMETTSPRDNIK